MSEWVDQLDLHDPNSEKKRHLSGNHTGFVSTVYAIDTEAWEVVYISPSDDYRLLQIPENEEEAREAHIFFSKKVKEGFVPENNLVDNFSFGACLNFLMKLSQGRYKR